MDGSIAATRAATPPGTFHTRPLAAIVLQVHRVVAMTHLPHSSALRSRLSLTAALLAAAAPVAVARAAPYSFDSDEAAFDAVYVQSTIMLAGKIVDASGQPLAGTTVTVLAFGDAAENAGKSAVADAAGVFWITGLRRRSVLLKISRDGSYDEIVPVDLQRPLGEPTVTLGDIALTAREVGRARLLFVGDTMFGRRFTDEDQDGVEGEPGDLIRPGSRSSDAKQIVAFVRDVVSSADLAVANLECTVTDDPATPHPYKSYTFYSHPETLDALVYAGFDAVDLANNHVFDYLDAGVLDTIDAVAAVGLGATGADMNETLAAGTTIHDAPGGMPLALQGFSTLVSDGSDLLKYLLVARDPSKPGALEASAANVAAFLAGEVGDRFAVPIVHGGSEYSSYPTDKMRALFVDLIDQGAGLVVAHHTHTAQGIGLVDPGTGPRFVVISLGNFIFDQTTFETWQSMIAVADVDLLPGGEFELARLHLVPVHVERYVPKLLAGAAMHRLGRHLGHISSTLPSTPSGDANPDGLTGAVVFPAGHRVVAVKSASQYTTTTTDEVRALPVSGGSTGVVEFARHHPADALAAVQSSATAQVEVGRDILLYGDFEDLDVDDAFHESTVWDTGESRHLQNSVVRSGIGAAVLLRDSSDVSPTTLSNFRNIPVVGGSELTLRGHVRGDNAGTFRLTTTTDDADGHTISTVEQFVKGHGTYVWTPFSVDVTLPPGAVDLRIDLEQSPPKSGEGRVFVDDLAVIQWDPAAGDAKPGLSLPAPNNYDHLRFTGIAGGGAELDVTLTHRIYALP